MREIVFVTGNKGKYLSMQKKCEKLGVNLIWKNLDLSELEVNDVTEVSKDKARQAYNLLNSPCFVVDSGFFIDNYPNCPGYPGAFVKRSGIANNPESLLEIMKDIDNRSCRFIDVITFYDGNEYYVFYDVNEGFLSKDIRGNNMKNAKSRLWQLFIPQGYSKTVAEMSDQEFDSYMNDKISIKNEFLNWYVNEYCHVKNLNKQ